MPSLQTVERFLSRVESGATVEAIEEFYAPSASMQENQLPPRVGKTALLEYERQAVASVRSARTVAIRPVLIEGNFVVVRWHIHFERNDGARFEVHELAYQRWEREQIVEEQFFYDPRQLKAPAGAAQA